MSADILSILEKNMPGPFKRSGGNNVLTICPFHKGGQEKRPSFSVNLDNGLYHCFTGGCPAGSGSLKKLLSLLQLPPSRIEELVLSVKPLLDQAKKVNELRKISAFKGSDPFRAQYSLSEAIQGAYDFCPTMLVEQGFSPDIMRGMGIGYDVKNQRIMYPIHDMYGSLAGYVGGATKYTTDNAWQKYRVYQGRTKHPNGPWVNSDYGEWFEDWFRDQYNCSSAEYQLKNHHFLWNFHRIWSRRVSDPSSVPVIYVVEGFKACMWMIQAGFENTVALMGSYVSERQQQMLHKTGCEVVLFLDNDAAGIAATNKVGKLLFAPMYGRVSVVEYPVGDCNTQPDDYEADYLRTLVAAKVPFNDHLLRGKQDAHFQDPSVNQR